MKTVEKIYCSMCGSNGELLYKNLEDKLFNAPGQWDFFICKNKNCSLIWLNPMPSYEDISVAYRNYYTHNHKNNYTSSIKRFYKKIQNEYLATQYGYSNIKSSILKNILYLDPDRLEQTKYEVMYLEKREGKLLDIGCGSGAFMELMNSYGWETIGVDFDEVAIKTAKTKNLNVYSGNLQDQKFPNDFFEAITLAHVLEHIYDPVELLRECYSLLKTSGKLVISTPNNKSLGHWYFKGSWRGLEPPRHIQVFSLKSLVHLIDQVGFKNFSVFTTNRIARYIYRASVKPGSGKALMDEIGRFTKSKARLFSVFEWILIKMKIECGEEIILIAQK